MGREIPLSMMLLGGKDYFLRCHGEEKTIVGDVIRKTIVNVLFGA